MGDSAALSLTLLHSLGLYIVVWEEEVVVYLWISQLPDPFPPWGPQIGLDWQIWLDDDQIKSENSFSVLKVSSL